MWLKLLKLGGCGVNVKNDLWHRFHVYQMLVLLSIKCCYTHLIQLLQFIKRMKPSNWRTKTSSTSNNWRYIGGWRAFFFFLFLFPGKSYRSIFIDTVIRIWHTKSKFFIGRRCLPTFHSNFQVEIVDKHMFFCVLRFSLFIVYVDESK